MQRMRECQLQLAAVKFLLRTIHDVKFDKKRDALLQRDGSEFPGIRASSSGMDSQAAMSRQEP